MKPLCLSIKGSDKRGVVSFLKNLVSSSCAMTMRCRTHYFTGVSVLRLAKNFGFSLFSA